MTVQTEARSRVTDLQGAVLQIIVELAERRGAVTGGHVERIQFFLRHLMESMTVHGVYAEELLAWEMDLLLMSSQLRDAGKITFRDEIAMKFDSIAGKPPSALFLKYTEILAGAHHEKWDGTGHPHRLRGTRIPLIGRLMAIAGVYDALTNERPYTRHEDAVRSILRESGTRFDPELVMVFLLCEQEFKEFQTRCG